ncbi:hypothetical protein D3C80_713560 [compost metagenome]
MSESDGFFGGIKKILFKDESVSETTASSTSEQPKSNSPAVTIPATIESSSLSPDERMKEKVYKLLESLNQPGCDFLELWNATKENGEPTASSLKATFNTLKYVDKSLTKEKIITSGNYYKDELAKAIDSELNSKQTEKQQLEEEKQTKRQNLSAKVSDIEAQLKDLQEKLASTKEELSKIDADYEPKLKDIDQKMAIGKTTINTILQQMQSIITIVEKEF